MENKEPKISVVITVYNSESTLVKCLDSVLNQKYSDFELIIVNNNSTDSTQKIIDEFSRRHTNIVYAFESVQKRGAARNTGEKKASGKIIAMTDADCIVPENWLVQISKPIIENNYDAVQGFEKNANDNYWSKNIQYQHERQIEYLKKQKDAIGLIDTKNFAISYEALKSIGFTNPNYSGNDTELSIRFQKSGFRLFFDPNIIVKHNNPSSINEIISKFFFRAFCCTKITHDHYDYLKNTSFIKQTNQTFWTWIRFFPGLLKTLILHGPSYTYFDFITGLSWRIGILYGKLKHKLK
ncbi:MAG: glycosyltransferase [Candidatus Cloacimonetes bacterium]|nr:glycosyltransferase [Candidatus Cloacimonadota bacterium]